MYIYIYVYTCIYIYIHTHLAIYTVWSMYLKLFLGNLSYSKIQLTPGLHNNIPAHKIFARVWVAQEPIFYTINGKTFQGLGPKRRESCDGDWV